MFQTMVLMFTEILYKLKINNRNRNLNTNDRNARIIQIIIHYSDIIY